MLGLLGPTGSGKSTLTDILAGLVNKTSGSASIWGFDIDADPRNAKYSIGIVPQEIVFDPFFTPYETLENQAGLYGVPKDKRISDELLGAVHLSDKRDAYARTLSGGMKRRPLVAKAMVHSPPRSEEHTSELQSLMRISYAVFCLKKKKNNLLKLK